VFFLILAPGIGTETASVGLIDAWRARFGFAPRVARLIGNPLWDLNRDGAIQVSEADAFSDYARHVGFGLRLPRSFLALQVGATLALCGATLQILLRNPLAEPYTLGIAGGGSLAALIVIRAGWSFTILGISTITAAAFLGAITVVSAALIVARGSRRLTSNELLLAGVTIGVFCNAMMMFVTAISSERATFEVIRWMMGSLDPIVTLDGAAMLPLLIPIWLVLTLSARSLNQYRLGDELASSRGVNVASLRVIGVVACSLATATVVAHCGPIGFVGLVVPHIVSLLFSHDCRVLLPASALLGAVFLVVCDWGSLLALRFFGWIMGRQLGSATLPIGVVTAMVGVPIFLVLLRKRKS